MEQENLLRIKRQLRLAMDGQTSTRMREEGYAYKLNYGASYPSLKHIASQFQPDADLAEKMYNSQVREQMILSTILHPTEQFPEKKAIEWVNLAPYPEIVDYLCMNLLQKQDYVEQLIDTLILSENILNQYAAIQLIGRVSKRLSKNDLLKYKKSLMGYSNHENLLLKQAAWNCVEKISLVE